MARILIEGGYVVSIKVRDHVIEDGMVAIVDDRIHYIGERSNFDDEHAAPREIGSAVRRHPSSEEPYAVTAERSA